MQGCRSLQCKSYSVFILNGSISIDETRQSDPMNVYSFIIVECRKGITSSFTMLSRMPLKYFVQMVQESPCLKELMMLLLHENLRNS